MTYTYSIFHNDRFELGTGIGIHLLQAEAQANSIPQYGPICQQRQEVSGAGAFPTIPLDFAFRISQRWSVSPAYAASTSTPRRQQLRYGWLADIHEDVQYRWKPNLSRVGIGYSYHSIRAKKLVL